MAIEFADPFAFYETDPTAEDNHFNDGMRKYWDVLDGDTELDGPNINIIHDGGREGRGCVQFHWNAPALTKNVTPSSEYIVQFAVRVLVENQATDFSMSFRDGSTKNGEIRVDNDTLIIKNATDTSVGTETVAWRNTHWHLIEVKFSYGSSGTVQFRMNETSWLTVTDNFAGGSTTQIDNFFLEMNQVSRSPSGIRISDFLLINTTVSPITDFIGDQAVFYSLPKTDVVSQFSASTGSTHATLVDDTDLSETEYVYSTGTSQLELHQNDEADQFDPLNTVTAVSAVVHAGLVTGASGVGLIPVVRLGGVDYPRPEYDAFTSETPELRVCEYIYEHPGLLAPFTIDQVEAFTFGFKTDSS